jgi:pimeloyl-[acyl-carrier protein] synthase
MPAAGPGTNHAIIRSNLSGKVNRASESVSQMTSAISIDFSNPTIQANPWPVYEELRANDPVVWNGPAQGWLISRYADVVSLFTDPRMSSRRIDATFRVLPEDVQQDLQPLREVLGARMLLSDPPVHTRLKNLVMPAFSAKAAAGRRERIQELCDDFLDRVEGQPGFDVMADLATPLPSWVIADTLGVPMSDQADFTRWAASQVRVYDRPGTVHDRVEVMRKGQADMLEMKAYLEEVIVERRKSPADDLLTLLVQAEQDGDRLTTDELVVMCVALLIGGNNSTAHLIGNVALTLLRHPVAAEALRADPALIRTTVEEVLRFESPVQATSRVATEDFEFHGKTIRAGDNISLLIGSANRDPDQFPDADRFDQRRHPNRHLTFAHGPHFCVGSALARNTTQIAILSLIQRFPSLEMVDPVPAWAPGYSFRHLASLQVATA